MVLFNLKIALLLANAYLSYRAWTPPVPLKVYQNEMLKETEKAGKSVHSFNAMLLNVLYTALCVIEALAVFALEYPGHPSSQLILQTLLPSTLSITKLAHLQTLTNPFLLGSALVLAGSIIRLHCFSQLGKLFTFDFCIRKDHELITSGLYAYLRHPSYTGVLLHYFGVLLAHAGRGSWLRETGYWWPGSGSAEGLVVGLLVWFYLFITTARAIYIFPRARDEDEGLRKEFGKKWDAYAGRVRYRIIPGVF